MEEILRKKDFLKEFGNSALQRERAGEHRSKHGAWRVVLDTVGFIQSLETQAQALDAESRINTARLTCFELF